MILLSFLSIGLNFINSITSLFFIIILFSRCFFLRIFSTPSKARSENDFER